MKIYLASSWRNEQQPAVLASLRAAGHEVYDFKGPHGFGWKQVSPQPPPWSAAETLRVLNMPRSTEGFTSDFDAMQWCDALVMLQPCGRSAALELGWACGAGKLTIALLADGQEPELMLKMANHICTSVEDVIRILGTAVVECRSADMPSRANLLAALAAALPLVENQAELSRHFAVIVPSEMADSADSEVEEHERVLSLVRAALGRKDCA